MQYLAGLNSLFEDTRMGERLHTCPSGEALLEQVSRLEGRDRPKQVQRPSFNHLLQGITFRHLKTLGKFWNENSESLDLEIMKGRIQSLLGGFAASKAPYVFIIKGHKRRLSVYIGTTSPLEKELVVLLRAHFPGIHTLSVPSCEVTNTFQAIPNCHLLAGVPGGKSKEKEANKAEGQMDWLVRGLLYTGQWALLVLALPLPIEQGSMLVDRWAEMVEQAKIEFQQPETTAKFSRLGELYVDLLELQVKRSLVGRTQGNWLTGTYLLSEIHAASGLAIATFAGEDSRPEPLHAISCSRTDSSNNHLAPQTTWLNSRDLANIVQFPMQEYPGYSINPIAYFDVNAPKVGANAQKVKLGWIQDLSIPTGHAFELDYNRLVTHTLIAGTTGSGKTNTAFYLLDELYKKGIPFLIIEPAKGEYRDLKSSFPELKVLTIGSNEAPFKVNPFYVPEGVLIQTHLDYLQSLFAASFVLYAPMPYILESALHGVYIDKGWDLVNDKCNRDSNRSPRAFPTLTDLYHKINEVVDRLGYGERIDRDVRAALHARVNSLRVGSKGFMLDTRATLDVGKLLDKPMVVEMKAIGNDDQKAFFIGLLLMLIYEHYQSKGTQIGEAILKHVTVIEEAHRLLKNVSQEHSPDFANPQMKSVQTFCNIIAEIRAYGEGFVIVEQSPVKLAPDALKNTNSKLIHRVISGDDREAIQGAISLNEQQREVLVSLKKGHAIIFTSGMNQPVLLRIPETKSRLITEKQNETLEPGKHEGKAKGIWRTLMLTEREQLQIRLSFSRWFLSSVFGSMKHNRQTRKTLIGVVRSLAPIAIKTPAMEQNMLEYLIPHLADWLATGMGKLYSWSFSDEKKFQELIQDLWKTNEKKDMLKRIFTNRTAIAFPPFDACKLCREPCRFRFFATLGLENGDSSNGTTQLLKRYTQEPTEEIIQQISLHMRLLHKELIEPSVSGESFGVGLCTLIMAAHRLGWSGILVTELLESVWQQIIDHEGSHQEIGRG